MRLAVSALALLTSMTGVSAQGFPRQLQGLWTNSPMTCAIYKSRGVRILARDVASSANHSWVTITAQEVAGTTRGKFIRSPGSRSVEVLDAENPNIMIDFTLRRDGFLEETVVGARASMMYVRCR